MKVLLMTVFVTISLQGHFQNLIPNPSFEDIYECPTPNDFMENCVGWISSRETSDHYHACASSGCITTPAGVCFGYQVPLDGEAFGAFTAMRTVESEYKEHMATVLNETLEIGTEYFLSFNVVRSNKEQFSLASNNQGALFTTYLIDDDNDNKTPIPNFAHINNEEIVIDTLNWVQMKGSFIADSAYAYMAIGNFFDDSNTDTLHLGPEVVEAFYAVDVVRLSTDSLFAFYGITTSIEEPSNEYDRITLIPNPAESQVTIECEYSIQAVQLYSIYGQIVVHNASLRYSKAIIDLNSIPSGIYFVSCYLENGTTQTSQLFKQ